MNVLYYWRPDNYRQDAKFGFGYHLNQNSPALARMAPGETVWAFTRDVLGRYVLAAALVVRAVTRNSPRYRYGRYRVWGDLERTRYFELAAAPDAQQLIRSLAISARAEILAQSFQGHGAVRPLDLADHQLLSAFAADLPVLPRVEIYPEDEFEARLVLGSSVRELLSKDSGEAYSARMRYLYETVDVRRARRHVEWLQKRYAGRCQICRYDPHERYGRRLCHGHHIEWLSRGGADKLDNMVLICPNHHAAVHQDDAAFNFTDFTFRFSNGLAERLKLNHHLQPAA